MGWSIPEADVDILLFKKLQLNLFTIQTEDPFRWCGRAMYSFLCDSQEVKRVNIISGASF